MVSPLTANAQLPAATISPPPEGGRHPAQIAVRLDVAESSGQAIAFATEIGFPTRRAVVAVDATKDDRI